MRVPEIRVSGTLCAWSLVLVRTTFLAAEIAKDRRHLALENRQVLNNRPPDFAEVHPK